MTPAAAFRIVVLGGGIAGRAALAMLPGARLVSRPDATAWHAEPGRLWTVRDGRVEAVGFDVLLVAAPVLQILLALGCRARPDWSPEVDGAGRCTVPGVFAVGAVLGARTPDEAAAQGRAAARAILGLPSEEPTPPPAPPCAEALPAGIACACLGLTEAELRASGVRGAAEAADLFALRTGACRMVRCGPALGGGPVPIAPALPVAMAALAAIAGDAPPPRPRQTDGRLA